MYQIFDDVLTKGEQETLKDIFFDTYFPYYMTGVSVDNSTYNHWSDKNTVVHSFPTRRSSDLRNF